MVTLDSDSEAIVRRLMSEHGLSFEAALNQAIHASRAEPTTIPSDSAPVSVTARRMGPSTVDLDHALRLLGDLDDDDAIRKFAPRPS